MKYYFAELTRLFLRNFYFLKLSIKKTYVDFCYSIFALLKFIKNIVYQKITTSGDCVGLLNLRKVLYLCPLKMKRIVQNSVTLLLAVLFLTSANGWNAVHVCCETCAEHGLQIFAVNDCAEVHAHHQHHEKTTANCCQHHDTAQNGIAAAGDNCSLHHMSVDNSTMQKQVQKVCFLPLVGTLNFAVAEFGQGFKTLHSAQTFRAPPPKIGRTILSRIALLLI